MDVIDYEIQVCMFSTDCGHELHAGTINGAVYVNETKSTKGATAHANAI